MSAYLIIGLPHHGKSLESAKEMIRIIHRNARWEKKTGQLRLVYSNLAVNQKFLDKYPEFERFIRYWDNPMQLINLKDVDIIWDEIARHIDSRDWSTLNPKLKRFIQEHDKVGIDIYANTQSPMQVDVMFRRNCEDIWRVTKLFGSRRPSPTRPPVSVIWGICILRKLKRSAFGKEESEEEFEPELFAIPNFRWIDRFTCEFFDTRQKIISSYPALEHIVRYCEEPGCTLTHNGQVRHA